MIIIAIIHCIKEREGGVGLFFAARIDEFHYITATLTVGELKENRNMTFCQVSFTCQTYY